jgi:hypothetical protein
MKSSKPISQIPTRCKCFDDKNAKELLCISSDLEILSEKNISQIKMFLCDTCKKHNIIIYQETLDVGYSSIILESEESSFHILKAEDINNGIVLCVDKKKDSLSAICFLKNFKHDVEGKTKIKYDEILPLIPDQYSFLNKFDITDRDDYTKNRKFVRFLKKYMDDPREDQELKAIKVKEITSKFGEAFHSICNKGILKGCLIGPGSDEEKDIIAIYGVFIAPYEKIIPLTSEQNIEALALGFVLGDPDKICKKENGVSLSVLEENSN